MAATKRKASDPHDCKTEIESQAGQQQATSRQDRDQTKQMLKNQIEDSV
jgi:hypothetical protein